MFRCPPLSYLAEVASWHELGETQATILGVKELQQTAFAKPSVEKGDEEGARRREIPALAATTLIAKRHHNMPGGSSLLLIISWMVRWLMRMVRTQASKSFDPDPAEVNIKTNEGPASTYFTSLQSTGSATLHEVFRNTNVQA